MVSAHPRWRALLCLAIGVAVFLVPSVSRAQGITNITYNEFKFGVFQHDAKFLGGREKGVDISPELIFQSPVSDVWASTVPAYLRWMVQPRPTFGAEANTAGSTNQYWFGATWSWQLFGNVFQPDDGIIFSFFFGPSFNDGLVVSNQSDRKSLGSNILFREAGELGYAFAPGFQISAYIDHVSNGGLAKQNQSINDVGLRLGIRF